MIVTKPSLASRSFTIIGFSIVIAVLSSSAAFCTVIIFEEIDFYGALAIYCGLCFKFFLWTTKRGAKNTLASEITSKEKVSMLGEQLFAGSAFRYAINIEIFLSLLYTIIITTNKIIP